MTDDELINTKIGNLTIKAFIRSGTIYKKNKATLLRCDCGRLWTVSSNKLFNKKYKCCNHCTLKKQQEVSGPNSPYWKGYKQLPGKYFSKIKYRAESDNIPINLTIKEAGDLFESQNGKCALSGDTLEITNPKTRTASLDRIDSSKGYYIGNVQWVHKNVNLAKNTLHNNEFIQMCKKVANNN